MGSDEVTQILVAVARVETEVKGLRRDDDIAADLLRQHSGRLDKLERIAYVALGVALASGLPQLAGLVR